MKLCFKCEKEKSLSEFYKHKQTLDGFLGKCKDCTKLDSKIRNEFKMNNDPLWREKELTRQRIKTSKNRVPKNPELNNKWRKENPEKSKAHSAVNNAIKTGKLIKESCKICGEIAEAHHEDYSKPLDVIWLCSQHHSERHIQLRQLKEYGITI